MARVVFDALAETQLDHHFQIEAGTLLEPLRLDQLVVGVIELQPFAQFDLDLLDGAQRGFARRHVMARREHGEARHLLQDLAGERIEQVQRLDHVVEQFDADRGLGVLRREDVDDVAAHAEHAALEFDVVALVLYLRQPPDDVALAHLLVLAQEQDHAVVVGRVADAVDRRHRADDHGVAPFQQRLGRRQPHLLDVFVDARILLDEQIARRHVGFGLIVIVVGDEILDCVFREELAHFRIQLRRQRLVRRHDQRRPAQAGNDVGHGESLARAGHPQQGLVRQAVLDPLDQPGDRGGLVAGRRKRLEQTEGTIGEGDEHR